MGGHFCRWHILFQIPIIHCWYIGKQLSLVLWLFLGGAVHGPGIEPRPHARKVSILSLNPPCTQYIAFCTVDWPSYKHWFFSRSFFLVTFMPSSNKDNIIPSFLLYDFFPFSCLTALARTFSIMLNRNEEIYIKVYQPSLICCLSKRKGSYVVIKYDVSCRIFLRYVLWSWWWSPQFLVFWESHSLMVFGLYQMLFLYQLIWLNVFFSPINLLIWSIALIFQIFNQHCIHGINQVTWSWFIIF